MYTAVSKSAFWRKTCVLLHIWNKNNVTKGLWQECCNVWQSQTLWRDQVKIIRFICDNSPKYNGQPSASAPPSSVQVHQFEIFPSSILCSCLILLSCGSARLFSVCSSSSSSCSMYQEEPSRTWPVACMEKMVHRRASLEAEEKETQWS